MSLLVSLWGAIGVVRVLQDAVNTMWGVPRYLRPHYVAKMGRGAVMLGLLGFAVIGSAVVAGVTLAVDLPVIATVGAALANIALERARDGRDLPTRAGSVDSVPPSTCRAPS